jgi:hypothetical protein
MIKQGDGAQANYRRSETLPIVPDAMAAIPIPSETARRCLSFPKCPIRIMRMDGHARTKTIAGKTITLTMYPSPDTSG